MQKLLHSRRMNTVLYCSRKRITKDQKIPFRDYRWGGPFIVQKVLPNSNYDLRLLRTNKTQILHRIRLRKFVPNQPLQKNFREERLKPVEKIVTPQGDLYTITWDTKVCEQLATRGNEPIPTSSSKGERPSTAEANSSDAHENQADYIIMRDELNGPTDAAHSRTERLNFDVSERNEANEAARDENYEWPNQSGRLPQNAEKSLPNSSERL